MFYCSLCNQIPLDISNNQILFRCECKALRIQTNEKQFRLLSFINLYRIVIKRNALGIFYAAIMENNSENESFF